MTNEKLCSDVKAKRERDGLSIRHLASIIGVSFSSLARIERGEGKPDKCTAKRMQAWLSGRATASPWHDILREIGALEIEERNNLFSVLNALYYETLPTEENIIAACQAFSRYTKQDCPAAAIKQAFSAAGVTI